MLALVLVALFYHAAPGLHFIIEDYVSFGSQDPRADPDAHCVF